MANDEDVARLRQGTAVWNHWRAQNPERRVDLGRANLRSALRGRHGPVVRDGILGFRVARTLD